MNNSGYQVGGSTSTAASTSVPDQGGYWPLSKCRKAYLDYLGNKTQEIEEQKDARRYYHSAHWTAEQLATLRKRRQPPSTRNRIARKIDGVVGLIERLKQDPKAFPRTPKHEQGAELATAVIRYVMDEQEWNAKAPEVARDGAIDGIGGVIIEIEQGDNGDHEVGFEVVEPDSFFYDPRSFRPDFSDARFMGEGKWVDQETAIEMFPDKEAEIKALAGNDSDLSSNPDRESKFFSFDGSRHLIRLVDIWYKHKGKWCWTIFTGSTILLDGESYLFDEKKKTICRYIMFSGNVDHDGDRYGFVRNMKSSQDSLNFKTSKMNFMLASRRLILSNGSVEDVEKTRAEWARADGTVVVNGNPNDVIKADDQTFDFAGLDKMLQDDKAELDGFGPNQALIGDMTNQSGRAIQLLQQAGMAELGPYILSYRGWKLRVYRAIFCAVQRHWTAERWIRVTDDEGLAQFVQLNGVGIDPQTRQPTMVNALGSLDVDIIIDEGPDTITAQQDLYETLSNVLPTLGQMLKPQEASAAVKILVDSSALPASAKKAFRDASQQAAQPDPVAQQAQQIQLEGEAAKVDETKSKTMLNVAKAHEAGQPDMGAAPKQDKYELPPEIQNAQALADLADTHAAARQKDAAAHKTLTDAMLAPAKAEHEASLARANFQQGIVDREADRKIAAKQKAQPK
jgi:hypothetical protein